MINIIIADDHSIIRKGLYLLCMDTTDLKVAEEAKTGEELIDKVRKNDYDIIILDISMPGKDVFDTLNEVKTMKPDIPVLIFTTNPEKEFAVRLIRAGASGYINKESKPEVLLDAIRRIANGGMYISPKLAELLAFNITEQSSKPLHENLTDREFQIMCMIATGKTLTEIAKKLYLSKSTVGNHRANILRKLNIKTTSDICLYAIRNRLVE
jgi:two-component system invasion response regulator UvrY